MCRKRFSVYSGINAPPNPPFQPTPLRGPKIVGILEADFVLTAMPT
jgi:hypothetical protein